MCLVQLSFVDTKNAKQGDLGSKVLPKDPTGIVWERGTEVDAACYLYDRTSCYCDSSWCLQHIRNIFNRNIVVCLCLIRFTTQCHILLPISRFIASVFIVFSCFVVPFTESCAQLIVGHVKIR